MSQFDESFFAGTENRTKTKLIHIVLLICMNSRHARELCVCILNVSYVWKTNQRKSEGCQKMSMACVLNRIRFLVIIYPKGNLLFSSLLSILNDNLIYSVHTDISTFFVQLDVFSLKHILVF